MTMVKSRPSTTRLSVPLRESPRKRKRAASVTNNDDLHDDVHSLSASKTPNSTPSKSKIAKTLATKTSPRSSPHEEATTRIIHEYNDKPMAKPQSKQQPIAESPQRSTKVKKHTAKDASHHQSTPNKTIKTEIVSENSPKVVRKRKTKEEKEAEAMPLATRTSGIKMYVGAHVSIAKGLENSVTNSVHIGGNAFALFLKSQRKWDNPPLKDENRDAFRKACVDHKFDSMSHVVPHGSYLVNLATPDKDKAKQAYDAFVDDLHRCEALGIKYYNFHPGSTNQEPLDEAIGRISANLNRALSETSTVVPLLENMAGRGSVIGSRFSDLRDIIAGVRPEFRTRIGICIDTCHAFAAGYDLRSPKAFKKTFQELDDIVGLNYLKAMHINDSKAPFDSHRDLHQNIGVGFLGLRAFHNVMNEPRLHGIPLVLETPCDRPDPADPKGKKTIDDKNVWAREIKLLESLIGMDPESPAFKTLERTLSDQGHAERVKMEASVAATEEKKRKKLEKGQKSISDIFGGQGVKSKVKKSANVSSSSESEVSDG